MAKWARLEEKDGKDVVFETYEGAEIYDHHPSMRWVSCPEWVSEDDVHENGSFTRPTESLEYKKNKKISEAEAEYQRLINAGFEYENNNFQINKDAEANMNAVYTKLAAGAVLPHGGFWRSSDNKMISMSDEKVTNFIDSVFSYVFALKNVLWTHKDNIRAMTRGEDVDDYDIYQDWQ